MNPMPAFDPNSRLYLAFAFGVGIILIGTINALFRPSRLVELVVALAGSIAAGAVMSLFAPELAIRVGGSVAGVSLVWQLSRYANVSLVLSYCLSLFRRERFRWAALAVVGVSFVAVEIARFDLALEAQADADLSVLTADAFDVPQSEDVSALAYTDTGAMIPMVRTTENRSAEDVSSAEETALNRSPHRQYLIRRESANDQCNCHGWVFAAGRYGVHGKNVDQILQDNRYSKVIEPGVDDLCIYRSADNEVLHTAVVRAICPDGTVLVEGKWGWMGVYIHPAGQSCYGDNFRFYHTDRGGHVLAGLHAPVKEGPKYAQLMNR